MFAIEMPGRVTCDGVRRREFLSIGAAGVGGLTLAGLLQADERAGVAAGWQKKSIINVYLGGGPSPDLDTFDLEPDAPQEFRGGIPPDRDQGAGDPDLRTAARAGPADGPVAIIRSLTGLNEEHTPNQTESGWSESSLRSTGGRPSLGSVVAKLQGANNGACPTFVDLTGHTKYGFLGPVYGAFRPDGEGRGEPVAGRGGDRQPAG